LAIAIAWCGPAMGSVTPAHLVSVFNIVLSVASLAMMTIGRGLAYVITNGEPIRLIQNYLQTKH